MKVKIALAGPSGTGKTTLAEYVSKQYGIPFITTSTKPLWDKHGIVTHLDLIHKTIENPLWGLDFQDEVLEYRIGKLKGLESFITDRSPVDNLVYFLMQNSFVVDEYRTQEYINKCGNALNLFNGLVYLPYTKDIVLEDDGKRINNKFYQMTTQATFTVAQYLLRDRMTNIKVVEHMFEWDMDARKIKIGNVIDRIK